VLGGREEAYEDEDGVDCGEICGIWWVSGNEVVKRRNSEAELHRKKRSVDFCGIDDQTHISYVSCKTVDSLCQFRHCSSFSSDSVHDTNEHIPRSGARYACFGSKFLQKFSTTSQGGGGTLEKFAFSLADLA
jgi:hypothetical protein